MNWQRICGIHFDNGCDTCPLYKTCKGELYENAVVFESKMVDAAKELIDSAREELKNAAKEMSNEEILKRLGL